MTDDEARALEARAEKAERMLHEIAAAGHYGCLCCGGYPLCDDVDDVARRINAVFESSMTGVRADNAASYRALSDLREAVKKALSGWRIGDMTAFEDLAREMNK